MRDRAVVLFFAGEGGQTQNTKVCFKPLCCWVHQLERRGRTLSQRQGLVWERKDAGGGVVDKIPQGGRYPPLSRHTPTL